MLVDVPPVIATEIGEIAEAPEGEQLRVLVARVRAAGLAQVSAEKILTAQLAGIAMNPVAYARFDQRQSSLFRNVSNLNMPLPGTVVPEVFVGAGFHGAVYATARHLAGYDKPYVLDTGDPGGAFAVSRMPSFYLNSENTGGPPGSPWDDGANQLNWLPGAPVQAAHISGRELTDNTVMRFVIRAALMMHARLITRTTVRSVVPQSFGLQVTINLSRVIRARRVIIAAGVGPEAASTVANGGTILTWSQAMAQMDKPFPFEGFKRVAVIGGGKSALCAAEALLGIGPDATMRSAAGGMPGRVDLYSTGLPASRQDWFDNVQARYVRLGSHLPVRVETDEDDEDRTTEPPGYGLFHDLRIYPEKAASPVVVPGGVLVNGRFYDHAVMCNGHVRPPDLLDGLPYETVQAAGRTVACKARGAEVYKVGPYADLPWETADYANRITANPEQRVAMHRLAPLTAALAATLPRT